MIIVEVRYGAGTRGKKQVDDRVRYVGPFARSVDVDRWVDDLNARWSETDRGPQPRVVRHVVEDAHQVLLTLKQVAAAGHEVQVGYLW